MSFEDAVRLVLNQHVNTETEVIPLQESLGRFSAEVIASPIDSPPFDKSAMDGYAVAAGDDSQEFTVLETLAAGERPTQSVKKGYCSRIMTGAMIPEGTGKVVRVEYTESSGDTMRITTPEPYENIIFRGENLKRGDPFFPVKQISPGDIGSLAASGIDRVPVHRQLRVAVLTTGSELREPGTALNPGEIYNSNGYQLKGQIVRAGALPISFGSIPDDRRIHEEVLAEALETCDLVLLSGGVSMGSFDYVPETLARLGVDIMIHGILVKPGRPTLFGRRGDTFVFGLPGNPVSSFLLFEVLVRPFIHHLMGTVYRPAVRQGILAETIRRRDTERLEFRPVRIQYEDASYLFMDNPDRQKVFPVRYKGSSHLNAMVEAEGIILMNPGIKQLEEGTLVNVRLL